ncbi:LysR family transcriptional regulator [Pseudofrankia sp. BMG5.37]|uniref:LysR family transcriptional regulator n=1 Tax=Pseudofrankia sp. BMG5.37 TaxID=3050035 RepID=UPI0028945C1C|nr:LysR family transcriptional regulator [Pseudofrankia sp. BMG5.37]MDT3439125.1 LysR family transcriptional regulator [Pseudofrankia sp. BMG5.37]
MDVRHLDLLRELAARGSVTAVAAATHRTPSAVSQQLRTAQREFGVRLVEPHGRGIRLTEAGRLLADAGRDVARVLAEVQARFDEFRGEPAGVVRVAALPSAATLLLPGVLNELETTAVRLECDDVDLAEHEYAALVADYDIVIGHSLGKGPPPGADDLVSVLLAREPLDIAMRADHPLAVLERVAADDLVEVEWYGVPVGYPFDTVRLAVEEATGRSVSVVQRLRDNRLVEALVARGDRVAVLPRFTTPTGGAITLREVAGIETGRYLIALLRPDRAERLAVRRALASFRHHATTIATRPT